MPLEEIFVHMFKVKAFGIEGRYIVNWDRMEGQWKQRRGKAVGHWGKTMNDELSAILGKYEELVGKLAREIRNCQRGSQATS